MATETGKAEEAISRLAGRAIFGANAAGYETARSGYPQALFDLLARHSKAHPRILEIGAGTGLATEGLLTLAPSHLTAVEPDAEMAKVLARKLVGQPAEIVCAPFTDAEVDGAFDLVACAAAFHWLEPESALAKIRGLLAYDGLVAVWWNSYFGHGQTDPFGDRVSELLAELRISLPPSYRGRQHYAFDSELHRATFAGSGFRVVDETIFKAEREMDARQVRDLFSTFSFVSLLDVGKRTTLFERLETLVNREFGGRVRSVHATAFYLAQ